MINYSGKLQQLLCLITCVLMVVAISIRRDGKVAGRELNQQKKACQRQRRWSYLRMDQYD